MKPHRWLALSVCLGLSASGTLLPAADEEPVFPVKVSPNGRYFVDQRGTPVFWLGTTQWQLFRDYLVQDARMIIEKSKDKGFSFIQVMLIGTGDGSRASIYGQRPWLDHNPLTPNEAYFKNVDAVMRIAREKNMCISMTLFHQGFRKAVTLEKARPWARWVAERYKDFPNLVWSMTPEAKPEFVPILRELAAGLREADGGSHLITFKPDPAPFTSGFIHNESWLDFNSIQTWKNVDLIYIMVSKDYHRQPAKPVLLAESAYENGPEYGFEVTPLWIRRQAYYAFLCGGHHTYGHNDSWRVLPTWRRALDAPGAVQMRILKRIFLERKEWWNLVPDQTVFAKGGLNIGRVLNLAARHEKGQWIMVYLGGKAAFSVNMGKLTTAGKAKAFWVNPRTGDPMAIGSFAVEGERAFQTPAGWEDALLLLEPEG
jgi:hypothetical protein